MNTAPQRRSNLWSIQAEAQHAPRRPPRLPPRRLRASRLEQFAVLPTSFNPTTLTAALVVGDELVVLGDGASTQLNLVTGASTSSATRDFGESCYYSPLPPVVGERIFTAYGAGVRGADDLGRAWTERPSPPKLTDPSQRRLVFPLSDGAC